MKRFGNLFESICSISNLRIAFYKAKKGKPLTHVRAAFEVNLEWELHRLKEELQAGSYQPGPYTTFQIYDPKERMISAAPFRDRVVHHALCNIIEPIFEPTLIKDTYANRKGKGTHAGIRRCQDFLRQYKYVLKADIRKYFPSIDHAFLGQRIFTTHRRLKRENVQRFRKRLNERLENYRSGNLQPDLLECQLNSWLGHAKQADTFRLRKQIYHYLVFQEGLNLFETDRFAWRLLEQQQ